MPPDLAVQEAHRAQTLQWFNALTPGERDTLLARVHEVQGWVDETGSN